MMRVAAVIAVTSTLMVASSTTSAFCVPNNNKMMSTSTTTTVRCTKSTLASSSSTEEQQQQRTAVNALDPIEEEAFLKQCKTLCEERNLPFKKVKNARDLASAGNSPVKPGRIFRMGRVGDATETDIQFLMGDLKLQTLVDLRSPTELKDDPSLLRREVFGNFTDIVWKEQGRTKDGFVRELEAGEGPVKNKENKRRPFWRAQRGNGDDGDDDDIEVDADLISPSHPVNYSEKDDDVEDDELFVGTSTQQINISKPSRKERYFVSLMNEFKYVKGTVTKLRKRDITKAILKSPGAVFSKRMRTSLKKPFLDEINDGGLPMLNELLLRFGAPGIKYVLELCADTTRHPISFYCTAGKDRTGMITAIILSLCGATINDIVEDYTLSANVYAEMNDHQAMVGALSQRNLDPKTFLGAPACVMRDTLQAINDEYGSVEGYCNWIGFGPEMQEQLRQACMNEYVESSSSSK